MGEWGLCLSAQIFVFAFLFSRKSLTLNLSIYLKILDYFYRSHLFGKTFNYYFKIAYDV